MKKNTSTPSPRMTERSITRVIVEHYGTKIWFPQLRIGTGFGCDAERTMDLWGLEPLAPWDRWCVEIKISRGDFRRDGKQPMKQRRARLLANEFYYATPVGLISTDELPTWAGLLEVSEKGVMNRIRAPRLDSSAPTWRFLAVFARLIEQQRQQMRLMRPATAAEVAQRRESDLERIHVNLLAAMRCEDWSRVKLAAQIAGKLIPDKIEEASNG